MIADLVDPRDIRWEEEHPVYRVYFWYQPPAPPEVLSSTGMYHSTEYRLPEVADVHEVIAWAEANAGPERTYTLYVEHERHGVRGLILLAGTDPTTAP